MLIEAARALEEAIEETGIAPGAEDLERMEDILTRAREMARARFHTVGLQCTDAYGDGSSKAVSVLVPHDQGR